MVTANEKLGCTLLSTGNKFPLGDQVHLINVVKPQVILIYLAMFTYLPPQCTLLRGPLLHLANQAM